MTPKATNIRFEEGLDYCVVRSNSPDVVNAVYELSKEDRSIGILDIDLFSGRIHARVPLNALDQLLPFQKDKGIRKLASSGGNASVYIAH